MQGARLLVRFLAVVSVLSCGGEDSNGPRIPAGIVIIPNQPVLPQGLSLTLNATVVDAAGKAIGGKSVTFSSADTLLATVSSAGVVTSKGPLGTVRITAALNGLTNFVDVVVSRRIVGIGVTPNPLVLNTQTSTQLLVSLVDFVGDPVIAPSILSFQSSQPSVAQVDAGGLVSSPGTTTGNAVITVHADTFVVQVPVTVTQIPTVLDTRPVNAILAPGASQQITATVRDLTGRLITNPSLIYVSSAPGVFTVSPSGLITAGNAPGSGTVVVGVDSLRDTIGVFVGTAPPGTILQRTPVPGGAYAAAVTSSGTLVVSLVGPSKVLVGTVQSFGFTDTLSVSLDPLGVAVNPAGTLAYVALVNSQKLGTIDLATRAVAYAPFVPADAQVLSVLASSDGQYVFVGTGSWLYKLSATTLTTLDSTPASFALHLAAHPTLPRIYASMQGTGYVEEIDIATMDSLRSFGPGSTIQAVDVAPDGSTLYVANETGGNVTSFDLATGNPGPSITTAGGAFGLVVGGSVLYVTCPQSGDIEAFDRGSGVRLYHKQNMGQPRRPALGPGGILVVPNENGTVDFIQ